MEKRIKSVIPIYILGVVFLAYSLIFPMRRITDVVIALGVAALCFLLAGRLFPGKTIEAPKEDYIEKSGNSAADEMIARGKQYIRRLTELEAIIGDNKVGAQIRHLQDISVQIFNFIAKNPGHARKIHTFMDYYYPTAMKFLESYAEFDSKRIKGENISAALAKISASLAKIEEAFEHQLNNLYSDKALDITTDIAVLENIMKSEGMI